MFNKIKDSVYLGVISFLTDEVNVEKTLSKIKIKNYEKDKSILVDLALVVGCSKYRFVKFNLDDKGKIIWSSQSYVNVDNNLLKKVNSFLQGKTDCVTNSFLTIKEQNSILSI